MSFPRALSLLLLAASVAGGLLTACSTRQALDIALSNDPGTALTNLARSKGRTYQHNPLALVQDIKTARRNFDKLVALLRGEVGKTWGKDEIITPGNKRYVKYTQNYMSRAIVQFDRGLVRVETLDGANPKESLYNAVVTTLLTPEDPRSVDLYSAKTVELSGRPYLEGLVDDQRGRPVDSPARAEAYARFLVEQRQQTRRVHGGKERTAHFVDFALVSDYENRQARRYAGLVRRYAKQFGVSRSLVFAVIKTESAFNPYAVSSAPAYGLMQLVPATGGRDAFRAVKGRDGIPDRDYLFDPQNNIELGTAYLGIIARDYLGDIADPVSREYCTISAYNGGAGNVLRLFSKDRSKAVARINTLPPSKVFQRLRREHPREETRRYLTKVLDARKEFINL